MKANAIPLLALFETKLRLDVPLFQRQYVWNKDQQWEPLWEDISRKFSEYLEGRKDAPVHFLGAMVLDQKQTPTGHVDKRQVIDGQQRMTTLQIFLSAFRDFCDASGCEELGKEALGYTKNKGMMSDPQTEKFKVWPTLSDRKQFCDVVDSGSREELLKRNPSIKRKWQQKPDPRPRMVEAYLYFYGALEGFFVGTEDDPPAFNDFPLPARLEESFQALKNALQVVVVDLDQGDDAQVIFETLNARGEPLLPADLLRNFIFFRAGRNGESQEELYAKYWTSFDEPFWREEVRQGRLNRPRSDLFMQHFLAGRQSADIPVKHLFVEYKFWIDRKRPFKSVEEELSILSRQGEHYRRLLEAEGDDAVSRLARFLQTFDIGTAYPALLWLMDQDLGDDSWEKIATALESYVLRRSVCDLTNKNYNRVFLSLVRSLHRHGAQAEVVIEFLSGQSGDSTGWPTDEAFAEAWMTLPAYRKLGNAKLVHTLARLNDKYYSNKNEHINLTGPLSIEHLMPQSWVENWPLPDGSVGMSASELWSAERDDPTAIATRNRNNVVDTMGNLTILTQPLNSAVSNSTWLKKRPEIMKWSLLPINQHLHSFDVWDEEAIRTRGEDLLARALSLWPSPAEIGK